MHRGLAQIEKKSRITRHDGYFTLVYIRRTINYFYFYNPFMELYCCSHFLNECQPASVSKGLV